MGKFQDQGDLSEQEPGYVPGPGNVPEGRQGGHKACPQGRLEGLPRMEGNACACQGRNPVQGCGLDRENEEGAGCCPDKGEWQEHGGVPGRGPGGHRHLQVPGRRGQAAPGGDYAF